MDSLALLAVRRDDNELRGRPHFWPLILLMLVLLALAVTMMEEPSDSAAAMPTPTEGTDRNPRVYTVGYRFGVFSPTNLRIHAGDTVRWHNESPLPIRVIAQLQNGQRIPEFDSIGSVQADGFFSYTFSKAGIYGYYNPSSANESGVIIVR